MTKQKLKGEDAYRTIRFSRHMTVRFTIDIAMKYLVYESTILSQ